jgi:ribokinase
MRAAPPQRAGKGTTGPLKGKRPVAIPGGADQKGKTDQAGALFTKTSGSGKGDARPLRLLSDGGSRLDGDEASYTVWAWLTQLRDHTELCKTIMRLKELQAEGVREGTRLKLNYVQAVVYACLALNDPEMLHEVGGELKEHLRKLELGELGLDLDLKGGIPTSGRSRPPTAGRGPPTPPRIRPLPLGSGRGPTTPSVRPLPLGGSENGPAAAAAPAAPAGELGRPGASMRVSMGLGRLVATVVSAQQRDHRHVLAGRAQSYIGAARSIQAIFRQQAALRAVQGLAHRRAAASETAAAAAAGLDAAHCLVFGACNLDMKAEVAEPIHTLGGLSTTGLFFSSGGGKGANQATSVARLGVPTSLVGRIGNDAISQGLLEMIRSTRLLDLSGLVLDKRNPSSMAIQLVHHNVAAGQSDKVNVFCQGCHDYVGEQECDVLRAKLTPQVRVLLLQLELPLAPTQLAARDGRSRGVHVMLKLSPLPNSSLPKALALLPLVDTCFCNEVEAPRLLGLGEEHVPLKTMAQALDAAQQMLSRWPSLRTAVVTCMAGYVLVQRHHESAAGFLQLMLPRRHHPVVEAIGAGDAFVGGFVAASCRQLCAAQALVWAHCTAMLSTQHVGAQDSMPTWGELCDCFEAELGATISRQQLTVARQPVPVGAGTAGGLPSPADAATAQLVPPLAARLPVASPLYLLQTETHLAAARADVPALAALLQRQPEHVTARDTLGLQPLAPHAAIQGIHPPCIPAHPTLQHCALHPAALRPPPCCPVCPRSATLSAWSRHSAPSSAGCSRARLATSTRSAWCSPCASRAPQWAPLRRCGWSRMCTPVATRRPSRRPTRARSAPRSSPSPKTWRRHCRPARRLPPAWPTRACSRCRLCSSTSLWRGSRRRWRRSSCSSC